MKKLFYNTTAPFLLLMMSFLLMSFHPKNNFRIEKRHYRKGFYVDFWFHPKTYPQTTSSPEVAVDDGSDKTGTPAPDINGSSPTQVTGGNENVPANDNVKPVSQAPQEAGGTGVDNSGDRNIQINHAQINAPTRSVNRPAGNVIAPKPKDIAPVPNN